MWLHYFHAWLFLVVSSLSLHFPEVGGAAVPIDDRHPIKGFGLLEKVQSRLVVRHLVSLDWHQERRVLNFVVKLPVLFLVRY
jgi:hypothetical protein